MKKLNIPILVALLLTFMAFLAHTIGGDIELHNIQPEQGLDVNHEKQQVWTMVRSGWHWISLDLLFATIVLTLISFTSVIQHTKTVLQLLMIYFLGYGIVWIMVLIVSDPFPYNFLKLGQWILLLTIGALLYLGNRKIGVVS